MAKNLDLIKALALAIHSRDDGLTGGIPLSAIEQWVEDSYEMLDRQEFEPLVSRLLHQFEVEMMRSLLNSSISDQQESIEALEMRIATLENDLAEANNTVSNLSDRLSNLED